MLYLLVSVSFAFAAPSADLYYVPGFGAANESQCEGHKKPASLPCGARAAVLDQSRADADAMHRDPRAEHSRLLALGVLSQVAKTDQGIRLKKELGQPKGKSMSEVFRLAVTAAGGWSSIQRNFCGGDPDMNFFRLQKDGFYMECSQRLGKLIRMRGNVIELCEYHPEALGGEGGVMNCYSLDVTKPDVQRASAPAHYLYSFPADFPACGRAIPGLDLAALDRVAENSCPKMGESNPSSSSLSDERTGGVRPEAPTGTAQATSVGTSISPH